jgi:hypothetical protein
VRSSCAYLQVTFSAPGSKAPPRRTAGIPADPGSKGGRVAPTNIAWRASAGVPELSIRQSRPVPRDRAPSCPGGGAAWAAPSRGLRLSGARHVASIALRTFLGAHRLTPTQAPPKGGRLMRGALQARSPRLATTIRGLPRPSRPGLMTLRRRHVSGEELEMIERLSRERRTAGRSGEYRPVLQRHWL